IFAGLIYWLKSRAARLLAGAYSPLREACVQGDRLRDLCLNQAQAYFESQRQKSVAKRDRELQAARERFSRTTSELVEKRDAALQQLEQIRIEGQGEVVRRRDAALAEAHGNYPRLVEQLEQQHEQKIAAIKHTLEQSLADAST